MGDDSLLMLLNEVRGKTLRLLADVDDATARFTPAGLKNHILWHAGHSLLVVEALSVSALTGTEAKYPPQYFDAFKWGGDPSTVTAWPPLAEVVAHLKEQHARLAGLLRAVEPDRLAQPIGDPTKGRTVRYGVIHGLHDEAGHQGEIWLLKKMARLAAPR